MAPPPVATVTRSPAYDTIIVDQNPTQETLYAWTNSTYNATIYTTTLTNPTTFYDANGNDITSDLDNADCYTITSDSSKIEWHVRGKGYTIVPNGTEEIPLGQYDYDRDSSKDIGGDTPTPSGNTYVGDRLYKWNDNSPTHQRTLYAWTHSYYWLGTIYTIDPVPTIPFSVYGPENIDKTAQYVSGGYSFTATNATALTYMYNSSNTYYFNRDSANDITITYPTIAYTNAINFENSINDVRLYNNTGSTVGIATEIQNNHFEYTPFDGNYRAWASPKYPSYGYYWVYMKKDNPQVGDPVYARNSSNTFLTYSIKSMGESSGVPYIIISEGEAGSTNTHYTRDTAADVIDSANFNTMFYACLTGDTEILMADKSIKLLKDINLDDLVLAFDPDKHEIVSAKVIYTDKDEPEEQKTQNEYVLWNFSDGYSVKTVLRHRFYNIENKCFKYMDEWKIGEHTLTADGKKVQLLSSNIVEEKIRHYTLTTEKYHNYFANGMLSGNRLAKAFELENE